MITVNKCYRSECANNDGYDTCECLWGIDIDQDGECTCFQYKDEKEGDTE